MSQNNRRSAARATSAQRTSLRPNAGWEQRKKWLEENPRDAATLQALGIDFTNRAGLPVVVANSDYNRAAQVAANTATAPQLTQWASSFMQKMVDDGKPGLLLAPFPPDHPIYKQWVTFPNFFHCLVGRISHPVQVGSTYQLGKGDTKVSPALFSETYLVSLLGLIWDFWFQDDNDGKLLDIFQRTCRNILQIKECSGVKEEKVELAYEKLELFQLLIRERDESPEKARAYQEFVDRTQPQILAHMSHTLSIVDPELMERSVLTSLGGHIMSLMTQFLLGEDGVQLAGVEEAILRMVLERAAKHVPQINVADCYELHDLIAKLHQCAGRQMEKELQRWAFVVELLRHVLLKPALPSLDASRRLMRDIRSRVKGMSGITTFCALIAPDAKFLNDAVIAELIRRASSSPDKKRMVLGMSALVTDCKTSALDNVVKRNCDRRDDLQRGVEAASQKMATRLEQTSLSDGAATQDMYAFVQDTNSGVHRHEPHTHEAILRNIAALIARGNVAELKSLLAGAQMEYDAFNAAPRGTSIPSPVLSPRKIRLMIRVLGSDELLGKMGLRRIYPAQLIDGNHHIHSFLHAAAQGVEHTMQAPVMLSGFSEPEVSAEAVEEVAFVPMSEAVARQHVHAREAQAGLAVVEEERDCAICYVGYAPALLANPCAPNGNEHPVDTHICASCRERLSECPQCRQRYHPQRNRYDSDSEYGSDSEEEY